MQDEIQTKKQNATCSSCHEGVPCIRHGHQLKVCDLCHRDQVIDRLTARKIKRTLKEGCLVKYYSCGWRVGYLITLRTSAAVVQPLSGYCGSMPDTTCIPLVDIKPEVIISGKLPATATEYRAMAKRSAKKVS